MSNSSFTHKRDRLPISMLAEPQAELLCDIARTGHYNHGKFTYTGGDFIKPLIFGLKGLAIVIVNKTSFDLTENLSKKSPTWAGKLDGYPARLRFKIKGEDIIEEGFDQERVIPRACPTDETMYAIKGNQYVGVGLYNIMFSEENTRQIYGTLVLESPELDSPICVAWYLPLSIYGNGHPKLGVTANLKDYRDAESFQAVYAKVPKSPHEQPQITYKDGSHSEQVSIHASLRMNDLFGGQTDEWTLVMLVEEKK